MAGEGARRTGSVTPPTFYDALGVDRDASEDEIVAAYRKLIRRWHPDIAGPAGQAKASALNQAFDTLRDPATRADYDRTLTPDEPPADETPDGDKDGDEPETQPLAMPPTGRLIGTSVALGLVSLLCGVVMLGAAPTGVQSSIAGTVISTQLVGAGLAILPRTWRWRAIGVLILLAVAGLWAVPAETIAALGGGQLTTRFLLAAALVSVFLIATSALTWRIRYDWRTGKEARAWESLLYQAGSDDTLRIFFIAQTAYGADGRTVTLLQLLGEDKPRYTMSMWGEVEAGVWVLVRGDGGNGVILEEVAGSAPASWEKLAS